MIKNLKYAFSGRVFPTIALFCLLVAGIFGQGDAVNPCEVTGETTSCTGTGLHEAEIELKTIKLNNKKNSSPTVNIDQILKITSAVRYTKRAKGTITTTFDACDPRVKTKRFKPEATVTWSYNINGGTPVTGSGEEFEVTAPNAIGSYILEVTFNASGDCIQGTATKNKIFALNVVDGPWFDIAAVKAGTTNTIDNGDYLCKNQGQDIEFNAVLSEPIENLYFDADDIVWSATPAGAGSFVNGATGEEVTWRQMTGFVSSTPDDVVITCTIPDISPREFKMTVVTIASASGTVETSTSDTFTSQYHPDGLNKTNLADMLTDLNMLTFTLRDYVQVDVNSATGDQQVLNQNLITDNVVNTFSFWADGTIEDPVLKVDVAAGTAAGDVWLTLERDDNGTPVLLHKEHVTVTEPIVPPVGQIVNMATSLPDPVTVNASPTTTVNVELIPDPGTTWDTGEPVWEVTSTSGAASGPDAGDLSGPVGPLNDPGQYTVKVKDKDGALIDDFIINVSKIELIGTDIAGTDKTIQLLNSTPVVTLDYINSPGNAETPVLTVDGTVKDYLAPITEVMVNGSVVAVTQTDSGPD